MEPQLASLLATALMTGMRQAELLGLRWSDLDLVEGRLTVNQTVWLPTATEREQLLQAGYVLVADRILLKEYPKDPEPRTLPLSPRVVALLKTHRTNQ